MRSNENRSTLSRARETARRKSRNFSKDGAGISVIEDAVREEIPNGTLRVAIFLAALGRKWMERWVVGLSNRRIDLFPFASAFHQIQRR